MKFRKKPVVIEAWQWDGFGEDMPAWVAKATDNMCMADGFLPIRTLEGVMHGTPGDWIIKGVKNEVYPCKPDIFEATYEKVDE